MQHSAGGGFEGGGFEGGGFFGGGFFGGGGSEVSGPVGAVHSGSCPRFPTSFANCPATFPKGL